jgi:hypothetical protein
MWHCRHPQGDTLGSRDCTVYNGFNRSTSILLTQAVPDRGQAVDHVRNSNLNILFAVGVSMPVCSLPSAPHRLVSHF